MKNFTTIIQIGLIILFFAGCKKSDDNVQDEDSLLTTTGGTVQDIEGNTYKTAIIDNKVWMASNLKTTKYNDGTAIPLVADKTAWSNLWTAAYCWYDNKVANKGTYGALYNWKTVATEKLCPTGWHVPDIEEWTDLINFLGGEFLAAKKLKENSSRWISPINSSTNETNFTALPGGHRSYGDGTFYDVGYTGNWWTSTDNGEYTSFYVYMENVSWAAPLSNSYLRNGFSVRCLKD